jgi:hypothetical protein
LSLTTLPRAGSSSTTSPPPHVQVPRHVARLITRVIAPLVVDYSALQARRQLLRLRRASGCLGTPRGSSRGSVQRSSSTTPRHATRPAARRAARCRLLHLAQARH